MGWLRRRALFAVLGAEYLLLGGAAFLILILVGMVLPTAASPLVRLLLYVAWPAIGLAAGHRAHTRSRLSVPEAAAMGAVAGLMFGLGGVFRWEELREDAWPYARMTAWVMAIGALSCAVGAWLAGRREQLCRGRREG